MRWLLWCFCLLAESYETINHYHQTSSGMVCKRVIWQFSSATNSVDHIDNLPSFCAFNQIMWLSIRQIFAGLLPKSTYVQMLAIEHTADICHRHRPIWLFWGWYRISAIHGPIANNQYFRNFFRSCFLLHYQKYNVFCALPFFQNLQKSGFMR